jgi:hypothetical protein
MEQNSIVGHKGLVLHSTDEIELGGSIPTIIRFDPADQMVMFEPNSKYELQDPIQYKNKAPQ